MVVLHHFGRHLENLKRKLARRRNDHRRGAYTSQPSPRAPDTCTRANKMELVAQASSQPGRRTRARAPFRGRHCSRCIISTTGIRNASVLPLPVLACPRISRPAIPGAIVRLPSTHTHTEMQRSHRCREDGAPRRSRGSPQVDRSSLSSFSHRPGAVHAAHRRRRHLAALSSHGLPCPPARPPARPQNEPLDLGHGCKVHLLHSRSRRLRQLDAAEKSVLRAAVVPCGAGSRSTPSVSCRSHR